MLEPRVVEQAGDREFRASLNAYLDQEAKAERRADEIEQHALYLVQKGQDFHPWTFERFEEAMGNAPDISRKVIFACVAAACDADLKNDNANHMALVAIRQTVEKYWLICAMQEAEKNG